MPEGLLEHSILRSFEQAAPFDEFQNFGIDPEVDADFEDIEELEDFED